MDLVPWSIEIYLPKKFMRKTIRSLETVTYTHMIFNVYFCIYMSFFLEITRNLLFLMCYTPWIWRPETPQMIFSKNIMRTLVMICWTTMYTHTIFNVYFRTYRPFFGDTRKYDFSCVEVHECGARSKDFCNELGNHHLQSHHLLNAYVPYLQPLF